MRGKERMLHLKLSSIIECVARGREKKRTEEKRKQDKRTEQERKEREKNRE